MRDLWRHSPASIIFWIPVEAQFARNFSIALASSSLLRLHSEIHPAHPARVDLSKREMRCRLARLRASLFALHRDTLSLRHATDALSRLRSFTASH